MGVDWVVVAIALPVLLAALGWNLYASLERRRGHCVPLTHDWTKRSVTTAMRDTSRGELWRCAKCPKVVCK